MKFNILKKIMIVMGVFLLSALPSFCAMSFPNINIGMQPANTPQDFTNGMQILIWLTILSLAPSILIMTTSFVRIVIVLSLLRQAIGVATLPPNQVLTSLALILTFFIMSPVFSKINEEALQPYMKNQITQQAALDRGVQPIRDFMCQTILGFFKLFYSISIFPIFTYFKTICDNSRLFIIPV